MRYHAYSDATRAVLGSCLQPGGTLCGGWIYAAQEDGTPLVKIGCSTNLKKRLAELRCQFRTPMTLIAAAQVECCALGIERLVHTSLAAARIEREWFYLSVNQALLERLVAYGVDVIHSRAYIMTQ
jgi:hypothetical protein